MDDQISTLIQQEFQLGHKIQAIFGSLCLKLNYDFPSLETFDNWIMYFNGNEFIENDFKEYPGINLWNNF